MSQLPEFSAQTRTLHAIHNADIAQDGWLDEVLKSIPDANAYARGYLTAKSEHLGESLSFEDEEFRQSMASACGYSIWGK